MKIWKKMEFWWHDREWHFHSDIQIDPGELVEIKVAGKIVLRKKVPKGIIWKSHLAGSMQPFKEKK